MKIKKTILFAFMVWMDKGGHSLTEKKGDIVMKRNGKQALIYRSKSDEFDINDYCQERYLLFLNHWLNYGSEFIEKLKFDGSIKAMKNRKNHHLEMLR